MIQGRVLGAACRLGAAERNHHVRQLDDRERALGRHDAAELLDPHLVMHFGIGHAQMHVPERHARLVVRRELRVCGMRDEKRERYQ